MDPNQNPVARHGDAVADSSGAELARHSRPQSLKQHVRALWPEGCALLAIALSIASAIPFHEPWVDEAQAWQLARSLSLSELFQTYIRYEGSPGLWHFLLWILIRAHVSYAGLHWICGAIAVAASAMLVFRSPFPRFLRLLLPFSFFLLYQYAVVARSYVLVPILLYLIAYCWKKNPLLLALLLGLLANVALHAATISAGLAFAYAWSSMRRQAPGAAHTRRKQLLALVLLGCFYLLALWTVWPPHDLGFKTYTGAPLAVAIFHFFDLVQPWGLAIPFWIAIGLCLHARGATVYLAPLALFSLFSIAVHISFWNAGLLFPLAIALLWITWPERGRVQSRQEAWGRYALAAMAALQGMWSVYALQFDHYHAYSPDRAAAAFLQPFVHQGATIAVTYGTDSGCDACSSVGLLPYFDHNIYSNVTEPFWWWSTHNKTEQNFQRLLPSHPAVVIIEMHPVHPEQPIDLQDRKVQQVVHNGYRVTNMFCGEMPEGFALKEKSCELILQPDASSNGLGVASAQTAPRG